MSERASTGCPSACSGDMYADVPSTVAVCVSELAVERPRDPEVEHLHLTVGGRP